MISYMMRRYPPIYFKCVFFLINASTVSFQDGKQH